MGLGSLDKAQKELTRERTAAYTRSMDDLKDALTREGIGLYSAVPRVGSFDTSGIGSLFGIRIYVDETLPLNRMELRNSRGQVVKRFSL